MGKRSNAGARRATTVPRVFKVTDAAEPKRKKEAEGTARKAVEVGVCVAVALLVCFAYVFSPLTAKEAKANLVQLPTAKTAGAGDTDIALCQEFLEKKIDCVVSWAFDDKPRGALIEQTPASGSTADTVFLLYSKGSDASIMPLVSGQTIEEAKDALWQAGLTVGEVTEENSSSPAGTVLSTSVDPAAEIPSLTSIDLIISNGKIQVPDWTGKTKEIVESESSNLDIKVEFREKKDPGPIGVVLDQSNRGSMKHSKTVVVTISISAEEELLSMPSVIGLTKEEAIALLAAEGFLKISTVGPEVEDSEDQKIVSSIPEAGEEISASDEIVINLS